jgi:hypothetical protein
MQSSVDDPGLAVLLELGAIVSELFEVRDLLRARTPYAALHEQCASFRAHCLGGGARIGPTEAGQVSDEHEGAAGTDSAASAADAEDTDLLRLRIRFCQDVLITNQMAEGESNRLGATIDV